MIDRRTLACVVALCCLGPQVIRTAAQEVAVPNPPRDQPPSSSDPTLRTTYRLGPDDQIVITAPDLPDVSGKPQRLDLNGDLRLPMVGRVKAGGLTLEELEAEVTKRLKVYIQEPDISVSITEFKSQPVSVLGAVKTAGVHQLEGRKTLIEMLSLVGGITPEAGPTLRIARRLEEGRIPVADAKDDPTGAFSIAEVDLKALLDARTPEKNIVLRPHDVISVPRADVVFVIGDVGRPGPLPLSGGPSMSVLVAVSSAGGVLRSAKTNPVTILRMSPGEQKRTEVVIDLKSIMQGKADDVDLTAGDILIIPDSRGKRAIPFLLQTAVQAGLIFGAAAIY